MGDEPLWLTVGEIVAIHDRQLDHHGGLRGVKDAGLVESAAVAPRNLYLYEGETDLLALAVRLCFALVKNHGFVDGNKRTAAYAMIEFLIFNGLDLSIPDDDADGPLLGQWIERLAAGEYDEAKLYDRLQHFAVPTA